MTPEQLAALERLSPTTQAFLARVARRIAEGYEGEIVLHVKRGRDGSGAPRGSISFVRWVQVEDGGAFTDGESP